MQTSTEHLAVHCPKGIKGGSDATCTCYRKDGQPKRFEAVREACEGFLLEEDPNFYSVDTA